MVLHCSKPGFLQWLPDARGYNNTGLPIDLNGWTLQATDGTPDIALQGIIPAHGFYLLERQDDPTSLGQGYLKHRPHEANAAHVYST